MPKVPLTATKDFKYLTRRLVAGDAFEARNAIEAKILTRVRKVAEAPKAKPARVGYERQGSGYDAGAVGHELAGRDAAPKPAAKTAPAKNAGSKARAKKAAAKK